MRRLILVSASVLGYVEILSQVGAKSGLKMFIRYRISLVYPKSGLIKLLIFYYMGRVKRICVFEHSVMTNFNCACPAIQRGQGSGFPSEGSS